MRKRTLLIALAILALGLIGTGLSALYERDEFIIDSFPMGGKRGFFWFSTRVVWIFTGSGYGTYYHSQIVLVLHGTISTRYSILACHQFLVVPSYNQISGHNN